MSVDTGFKLAELDREHAADVARLHRIALPKGFLSTFSNTFLSELYMGIASAPNSTVIIAVDESNTCLGFISGSMNIGHCYKHILTRSAIPLFFKGLTVLVKPQIWRKVCETLLYPFRKSGNDDNKDTIDIPAAELLSIAVDAKARGLGIGKSLILELETAFAGWGGVSVYKVVTDATDPRSNAFYRATGFSHLQDFKHHEHRMSMYSKELNLAVRAGS